MSDPSFSPYKRICRCGHDICTHFDRKAACLGSRCDCDRYHDQFDEDPPPTPRIQTLADIAPKLDQRPHADPKCDCWDCFTWDAKVNPAWPFGP